MKKLMMLLCLLMICGCGNSELEGLVYKEKNGKTYCEGCSRLKNSPEYQIYMERSNGYHDIESVKASRTDIPNVWRVTTQWTCDSEWDDYYKKWSVRYHCKKRRVEEYYFHGGRLSL